MKSCSILTSVIIAAGLLLFSSTSPAVAETKDNLIAGPLPPCSSLIKKCFMLSGSSRGDCFFSAAKHPFCDGTQLGNLALKRWAFLPNRPAGTEAASAFLGPQLVDQQCLLNFDNQWSSSLLREDTSKETINKLDTILEGCVKDISNDLSRP